MDNDSDSGGVFSVLASLYGMGAMVAFLYFSWLFAVENGFIAWLLLGFIVPVMMSAVWPIWFFVN